MEITLQHYCAYLPYNVGVAVKQIDGGYIRVGELALSGLYRPDQVFGHSDYRLILKSLWAYSNTLSPAMSALNLFATETVLLSDVANRYADYSSLPYGLVQLCLRNHVDIFNMVGAGLAITDKDLKQ